MPNSSQLKKPNPTPQDPLSNALCLLPRGAKTWTQDSALRNQDLRVQHPTETERQGDVSFSQSSINFLPASAQWR